MIMEKVAKPKICYKMFSYFTIIVLFSLFFFFSSFKPSPSLPTILIAILSTMFLVTLTRKKGSPDHENSVQDNLQKSESHPTLLGDVTLTHTEVTNESETTQSQRNEQQASEELSDSSFQLGNESINCSIMDRNVELNVEKYEQQADPQSDSSLSSDSESSSGQIMCESFDIDHIINQNLGVSNGLALSPNYDEEEEEDGLIEIKLPSSYFYSSSTEDPSEQKLESDLPEFLPSESIFKQQGLMELLAEINNEMNEDENLIEIDISMGLTKCQDLRVKQEMACFGDQCVLSD